MTAYSLSYKIFTLQDMIIRLEWDIPHIINEEIRKQKEQQLLRCKQELEEQLKSDEVETDG